MTQTFQVEYAGRIKVSTGKSPIELYLHQNEAIKKLDQKNKSSFEGLLVLPTGGGKTLTAVHWLLRNFIDKKKKVLWIAHRHELLNQALETLKLSAYSSLLSNVTEFNYRTISGHPKHDIPVNIQKTDDIIIASKDSLNGGLNYLLNQWIRHSEELLLVVDEAHHATAKTYRKLINSIKENFKKRGCATGFRMLGLTATPFRTDEDEKGLLKLVFPDDIIPVVDLRTLITRGILTEPVFEKLETQLEFSRDLTAKDIKRIEDFDKLPGDIAQKIAESSVRNHHIVSHCTKNREKYRPLLVFAIDINHAITLNGLFKDEIGSDNSSVVVSQIVDADTKIKISPQENIKNIERFRNGELEVLISVEMLAEGVDLPNVQTVFLTRPTTSTILMTQMIGRALRGQKAGGTEIAHVVSFIDEWEDKINWVNPEKLHLEEDAEFIDKSLETSKKIIRLISINLMEEFARIMNGDIDTTEIEKLDFLKRVPVGIYRFSILEPSDPSLEPLEADEPVPRNYDVLLYDKTEEAYDDFVNDLETFAKLVSLGDRQVLTKAELEYLLKTAKEIYFPDCQTLIGYRDQDVKDILRFYAQKQIKPEFLSIDKRKECDLLTVARDIYDSSLGGRAESEYIDSLWNDDKSFWQVLFGYEKLYFRKLLDIEIYKIEGLYGELPTTPPVVIYPDVPLKELTLNEIKERDPLEYRKIKDAVFAKHTSAEGFVTCAISRFKSQTRRGFQIDHVKPMSEGGLSTIENLQVLSHPAHVEKTRQENLKRYGSVR